MATQKLPKGRPASPLQCEFAAEILAKYLATKPKDHSLLTEALQHFSKTGDFSPFSPRNQELKKRAIFHRTFAHAKNLKGDALLEYASDLAIKYEISEETALRMIKGKTTNPSILVGADGLMQFLENRRKDSPQKKS
jgi:hypothetical protein